MKKYHQKKAPERKPFYGKPLWSKWTIRNAGKIDRVLFDYRVSYHPGIMAYFTCLN